MIRGILTIARRERMLLFYSSSAWIFASALILISSWLFMDSLFLGGYLNMSSYFGIVILMFAIFIPAISMNLVAEEKKKGGWETMISCPILERDIVLGKYLGSLSYLIYSLLLTLPLLVIVSRIGSLDWGVLLSSYLGIFLLGSSYLALGIFMSSISLSGIVAFLGSVVFLVLNNLMGEALLLNRVPTWAKEILSFSSLTARSKDFFVGVIDFRDLFFFLSWTSIFLILSVLVLKARDRR